MSRPVKFCGALRTLHLTHTYANTMDNCIDKVLGRTQKKLDALLAGPPDLRTEYVHDILSTAGDVHTHQAHIPIHGKILQCYLKHCRVMLDTEDSLLKDELNDLAFPQDTKRFWELLSTFLVGLSESQSSRQDRKVLSIVGESMLYWVVTMYHKKRPGNVAFDDLWSGTISLIDRMVNRPYSDLGKISASSATTSPSPTSSDPSNPGSTPFFLQRVPIDVISFNVELAPNDPIFESFETILDAEAYRLKRSTKCTRSLSDNAVYTLKFMDNSGHIS